MSEGFAGLRVVVTGAAGGIGTELCRRFVAEGAEVVAIDVDADSLAILAEQVGVITVELDLTDRSAVESHDFGTVDVLVNNAGVTALGPFAGIDGSAFERVVAVNLIGAATITRALLGTLEERHGRIAVLSSVAGFSPLTHRTAYSASKHGLHGLFESLRTEVDEISITMVCPTFADTGIERRAVARAVGPSGGWSTTGRHLSAGDVADAVVTGLRNRKRLVLPGATAKIAYVVSRLAPAVYEALMRRRLTGRGDY